ncbi:SDR family NAD(P)-dependent oxidoreductase [Paenibacillus sp.]|uniref:type I polyketide synthase n=1 Tax=Paenibacillus sp. TaxID=58172 RepID=UPI0028297F92|nr:SDR family NAD(P)-dependent oxidoreductase [Paenibacillus sp.]MDR0270277.1 SDR family NAD(P)-dependent oxidoreductase [Paenibacillus sp.]
MLKKLFDTDEEAVDRGKSALNIGKSSKKDIAIIGISGRFAGYATVDEFWQGLISGEDAIVGCPRQRVEDASHIASLNHSGTLPKRVEAGYMDRIDLFDYGFFNLSLSEAKLMDPQQRLFLEEAWSALEDAGYGGEATRGTSTGVFVGHSSDLKFEYHQYVKLADPEAYAQISVPGNVQSIIASRISYLLDLRGPSLLIDTACSSALVALHYACQALINKECEMAIVGGIKINILPITEGIDDEIGIRSASHRARTFDDSADGIGSGEGVSAVLLKPLAQAEIDGDNIYAIIKGSAVNQDGSSIGITAPSSSAQEEVILRAWDKAGINPENISYLETHGTATRLGDPIEVSGIERAFRRHTDKKAFCAIGSVKSNLGHLDNAAGMPGLIKLIQALRHKQLPPTLHFLKPNRQIPFIDSPVFVNDQLTSWSAGGSPLFCGISAFGLSGTNCHVVLAEHRGVNGNNEATTSPHLFTLSAKSKDALLDYIESMLGYLKRNQELQLADICLTMNTGRMHHHHRLVAVAHSTEDLLQKLSLFQQNDHADSSVLYQAHRIIPLTKSSKQKGELTEEDKKKLGTQAEGLIAILRSNRQNDTNILLQLMQLYIDGAEINWVKIYQGTKFKKVSLPGYPFQRSRCWVDIKCSVEMTQKTETKSRSIHPLLDHLLTETVDQRIYQTRFLPDEDWVLGDHCVGGSYVMPGTAYLEMIKEAAARNGLHGKLQLNNLFFLTPFALAKDEAKVLQLTIGTKGTEFDFTIASQSVDGMIEVHVEGSVTQASDHTTIRIDIDVLNHVLASGQTLAEPVAAHSIIEMGPRWTSISKKIYQRPEGYLTYLEMAEQFENDFSVYSLHPAMLDRGINAVNSLLGSAEYLPLSYKKLNVYQPIPTRFYSIMQQKNGLEKQGETVTFDVKIVDLRGNVLAEATDYTVKKVEPDTFRHKYGTHAKFYETKWVKIFPDASGRNWTSGTTLLFKDHGSLGDELAVLLRQEGLRVIEVEPGACYEAFDAHSCQCSHDQTELKKLLGDVKGEGINRIVHMAALNTPNEPSDLSELKECESTSVQSLFALTNALVQARYTHDLDLIIIGCNANEVTGGEEWIAPHHNAMFGLAKTVRQEYHHLKTRCIDIDVSIGASRLLHAMNISHPSYLISLRKGEFYTEQFKQLDMDSLPDQLFEIKDDGVYLITGGLGGLGLEMAKYFAVHGASKLALIGRREWPEDELELARVKGILDGIRQMGAEVRYYQTDVSDERALRLTLEQIRSELGPMHGIVHCAGNPGDGFLIRKNQQAFDEVLNPKLKGTWLLDKLTADDDLSYLILFSSVTSLTAGPGQGDYTAANAYLDSFAAMRCRKGKRTMAINWAAWRETGMAFDYKVDERSGIFRHLSTDGALTAFTKAMKKNASRIFIGDLQLKELGRTKDELLFELSPEIKDSLLANSRKSVSLCDGRQSHESVLVSDDEEVVFSETEIKVAAIWAQILELEQVHLYDSFNSMGGDSILATRLLKKLENEFPGAVDIADVFRYVTVFDMARYIESVINPKEESTSDNNHHDLDELLDKLASGELSVDEASSY